MIGFLPILLFTAHCAALPAHSDKAASTWDGAFFQNIAEVAHAASNSRLEMSYDDTVTYMFWVATILSPRAIRVLFISIVAIVARLLFLVLAFLVMHYWPSTWAVTPNAERGPLLPIRASNPLAVRPTPSPLVMPEDHDTGAVAPGGFAQTAAQKYGLEYAQSPTSDLPLLREEHQPGSPSMSGRALGSPSRRQPFVHDPCNVPLPTSPLDNTMDRNPRRSLTEVVLAWMYKPRALSAPNPSRLPPRKKTALVRCLTGLASLNRYSISILAVGVSKGSEGPAHNLKWLRRFFKDEADVSFKSLLDEQATHSSIKQAIKRMYMSAQSNTQLVLYHTGHGDDDNALDLPAPGEVISESIIGTWIEEFRQERREKGLPKNIKVLVIFDFCRINPSHPSINLSPDVVYIWASSPGEYAVGTSLDDNLPYSLLLNALFVAIDDVQLSPGVYFFQRVRIRVQQILRVVYASVCGRHECTIPRHICLFWQHLYGSCCVHQRHPENVNQTPAASVSDEDIDGATFLKDIISRFPWQVRQVTQMLRTNQWFLEFNPAEERREARALMFGIWLPSRKMEVAVRSFTHPYLRRRDSEMDLYP
ncbi:hypothetical protein BDV93DRAFT_528142 [Ceratobasidium sp. AG-I]|nr:hypothetical protein BDV93DRAFT_528142 [Ceratobasidium sp. AG-I]